MRFDAKKSDACLVPNGDETGDARNVGEVALYKKGSWSLDCDPFFL
jgi:serine protease inhibitor